MLIKDVFIPKLTTIESTATMNEAEKMMRLNGFRHLPVSDGEKLVGIISDRDIKLATVVGVRDNKKEGYIHSFKLVSEFMSSPVLKAKTTDRVDHVVRNMVNLKVSCFVIEDEKGEDVGILTTEDFLITLLDVLDQKVSIFTKIKSIFLPAKS